MRAAGKTALPEIRRKLREGMLQIFLGNTAELLCFKAGKAGVSASLPPQISKISTSRVVCRPRPSFWLICPVSRCSAGASVLSSVDLPTPELPQKAQR